MKTKADRVERFSERRANRGAAKRQALEAGSPTVSSAGVAQTRLQQSIDQSPRQLAQAERLSHVFGTTAQRLEEQRPRPGKAETVQRQGPEEEEPMQGKLDPLQAQGPEEEEPMQGRFGIDAPVQREEAAGGAENRTGMPDGLKMGLERLSGEDLSDVQVHSNSTRPAAINALAYAQGSDIHLGPGQEEHLPHEAWHLVQQRQGRVRPTTQLAGVQVNDDPNLEQEADVMGAKAMQLTTEEY